MAKLPHLPGKATNAFVKGTNNKGAWHMPPQSLWKGRARRTATDSVPVLCQETSHEFLTFFSLGEMSRPHQGPADSSSKFQPKLSCSEASSSVYPSHASHTLPRRTVTPEAVGSLSAHDDTTPLSSSHLF